MKARWLVAVLFALSTSGCLSSLEKEYPDTRFFVFDTKRSAEPRAPVPGATLKVRGFRISPRYEGKEVVARVGELRYETYFYHQFFTAPSTLISEEVYRWFSNAGVFEHVVDSASLLDASHILDGAVTALYGDFKDSPKAVLEIQFFLFSVEGAAPRIVFKKDYRRELAVASKEPTAVVSGWNESLASILTELESDLAAAGIKVKPS